MENINIRKNIRNKQKKPNYNTKIYQDRYILHPDTDSNG